MGPKNDHEYSKEELDNHANQLNENNDAYWESRVNNEHPDDWEDVEDWFPEGAWLDCAPFPLITEFEGLLRGEKRLAGAFFR